ncbi:hypothetical protein RI129_012118 [Pyrocoelia pectoralis]|uniref:GPI ethanolamine phosphate transferase 1 n=1 Tax=Pyrocoelia pectoralis TaxID=417401 RepID=A0AAN7V658_9COLE
MDKDSVVSLRKSVALGVAVHLLMLCAVFDIYFVSPIEQGMTPFHSEAVPLAKRVVLFVSDGLRASSLYEDHKLHSPYLRYIMENVGVWGISHTQVPTESRPGHIALLAGFNEDPSAITRGWSSNPVDFDSVINQSSNAWCWGSPDIVEMFNKDKLRHIHLYSYDANMQDFSGKSNSSTDLDLWVFDRVKSFVEGQRYWKCSDFCESGNIMFLHLLGLDTAGHSIKPTSKAYIENIKVVDQGIEEIVQIVDNYFNDNMTAYIFTSDHGMTNWGSHGDGSKNETEVPFIAWGAGITRDTNRLDLKQIDIAPLLSSLVGINIPTNAIGVVPERILKGTMFQKSHIMYANSRQLTELFIMKHNNLEKNTASWVFQPFPDISLTNLLHEVDKILQYIRDGNYKMAMKTSHLVIDISKAGINYYHTYHQHFLLFFVTFGFVAWIIYLLKSIISFSRLTKQSYFQNLDPIDIKILNTGAYLIYTILAIISISVFVKSSYKFYLYFGLCFTWIGVAKNLNVILLFFKFIFKSCTTTYLLIFVSYVIGIELLVASFFKRTFISFVPLYYFWKSFCERDLYGSFFEWSRQFIVLMVLAICSLVLNLQTEFSYLSLFISVILWIEFYAYVIQKLKMPLVEKQVLNFQFFMLMVSFFNVIAVNWTISNGYGLLLLNRIISWSLLVISPVCPTLMFNKLDNRVLSSILALAIPYTLMAVGFEHAFMHLFIRVILNWSSTESLYLRNTNMTHRYTLYRTGDLRMIGYSFYLVGFVKNMFCAHFYDCS